MDGANHRGGNLVGAVAITAGTWDDPYAGSSETWCTW
jgi:hypothetical protein